jgi:methyl-accepting chemotaxis protein
MFLRRWRIRTRLLGLAGGLVLLLAGISAIGYTQISRGSAAAQALNQGRLVQSAAQTVQYDFADLNGWQNAYAFSSARMGPAGAADGADNRKAFLGVSSRTRTDLGKLVDVLAASPEATDRDRQLATTAQTKFEQFMTVDARIATLYREGGKAASASADNLVNNDEVTIYNAGAGAVNSLASELTKRLDTLAANTAQVDSTAQTTILVTALLALLVGIGSSLLVTTSIATPLRRLRDRLERIAHGDGDLTARLDVEGRDELADVSGLFNTFVGQIAETVRDVGSAATAMAAATEELSANAATIAGASEEASAQAGVVSEAGGHLSGSVDGFATAAGELGLSIGEIAENASAAARVAATAVQLAEETTRTVTALGNSSAEITGVVKLITGVAEQTNLLALNATIEAARAGDAGKGFAVVASEVKDLAQETGRATGEITNRIEQIQAETEAAVSAIQQIAEVIAQINDYQASIAGAVEQQSATATHLNSAVQEAAADSHHISSNITGVADAAHSTARSVTECQEAVSEIARMSTQLHETVSRFRV